MHRGFMRRKTILAFFPIVLALPLAAQTVSPSQIRPGSQNGQVLTTVTANQPPSWQQVQSITLQHNGTNLANQSLLNFNDTTPAAPSGYQSVTFQADGSGDLSGYVPTLGSGLQMFTTPPIAGQYLLVTPSSFTKTLVGSGVSASANNTSGQVNINYAGTGTNTAQVTWSFTLPSGISPASVTAIYPFMVAEANGQNSVEQISCSSGAGFPPSGNFPLAQYTLSSSAGTNITSVTCNAITGGSVPFLKLALVKVDFVGAFVYYTGTPITSPTPLNVAPPLYYNSNANTLGVAPINLGASGDGGVYGNLPVANLNSGTGASASTFWRGDGTWAPPSGATANALTAAATGGAAPGTTFNGSAPVTFDYHSFGAAPTANPTFTGTATLPAATVIGGAPANGQFWGYNGTSQGWFTPTGGITALTGDVNASGPGSAAATVVKVNGGAVPASTSVLSSNASGQITALRDRVNLLSFGAVGDARDVLDVVTTASSTTITSATANFTAADVGKSLTIAMGAQGVLSAVYVSGITATGSSGQTCAVTFSTPSGGAAATGHLYLSATNTVTSGATIFVAPNYGTGYTAAPTSATAGSGTATCSGAITITSTLVTYPVATTIASVTNSTTAVMATPATTSGTSVHASIYTDNLSAVQNWINACETYSSATCYIPNGEYGMSGTVAITSMLKIEGDGVSAGWGNVGMTGYSDIMPMFAPYLSGSVLVDESASQADGIDITAANSAIVLRDFGLRFSPAAALWLTGYGIKSKAVTGSTPVLAQNGGTWSNVMVWGTDGSHAAYRMHGIQYWTAMNLQAFGGASLSIYADSGLLCCSGNSTIINFYGTDIAGGSANAFEETGTTYNNLMNWLRPQENGYPVTYYVNAPLAAWPIPPPDNKSQYLTYFGSTENEISLYSSDFEGSSQAFSKNQLPIAPTTFIDVGGATRTSLSGPPFTFDNNGAQSGTYPIASFMGDNPSNGTDLIVRFGREWYINDSAYVGFHYASGQSTSNFGELGTDQKFQEITWWPSGNVGVGMGSTAPSYPLQVSGPVGATAVVATGAQTISGCSLTAAVGGSSAGSFASGTAGACTVTITPGITAPNGWRCTATDITTTADLIQQTGTSTTSCTISGTTASGDVLTWSAVAY